MLPHVRYCVTVWGSCTIAQKQRVQKVINFGARIVTGLGRRDHITPALDELGWSKIDGIITECDIATMRHLITSPNASQSLREQVLYRSDVSVRETRATADEQLQLPKYKGTFAQRSFLYRATIAWNALPSEVRRPASAGALQQAELETGSDRL